MARLRRYYEGSNVALTAAYTTIGLVVFVVLVATIMAASWARFTFLPVEPTNQTLCIGAGGSFSTDGVGEWECTMPGARS